MRVQIKIIVTSIFILLATISCRTIVENNENPNNEKTLVIFGKERIFTSNSKKITDTLSADYFYEVFTTKEKIRGYTGSKKIKKVIVIN